MSHLIRRLTSLANLTKTDNPRGQISTLLILLLVIMLMFVLATVNIGNVALRSTTIANAADTAALQLASNLATKSRQLYEGLGGTTEKCKKSSMLSMIIALVVAIIAVILCQPCLAAMAAAMAGMAGGAVAASVTFTAVMAGTVSAGLAATVAVGAIAGTIGGMVGAAIGGTSIAQGALTGFAVGVAVGGMAAGTAALTAPTAGAETAGMAGVLGTMSVPTAVGAVSLGALSLASTGFNEAMRYSESGGIIAQIIKMMTNLNEQDRFTLSAFFTAFSQTVDDPNRVPDVMDMDGDGNTLELVNQFSAYWFKMLKDLQANVALQQSKVTGFINAMKSFRDFMTNGTMTTVVTTSGGMSFYTEVPGSISGLGALKKLEYAISGDQIVPGISDGPIVHVLRGLRVNDSPLPPWQPAQLTYQDGPVWLKGPDFNAMKNWMNEECGSGSTGDCSDAPAGFDFVDQTGDDLAALTNFIGGIIDSGEAQYSWASWVDFFYSSDDSQYTYYKQLGDQIAFLRQLKIEIEAMRGRLPVCANGLYDATGVCFDCATAQLASTGKPSFRSRLASAIASLVTSSIAYAQSMCYDSGGNPIPCPAPAPTGCKDVYGIPIPCPAPAPVVTGTGGGPVVTGTGGGPAPAPTGCKDVWGNPIPCPEPAPAPPGPAPAATPMCTASGGGLVPCSASLCGLCVMNPPCQSSVDENNTPNDFDAAQNAIDDLINHMEAFRTEIYNFASRPVTSGLEGYNPMTYTWEDGRGTIQVTVATNFRMPRLAQTKSGGFFSKKTCTVLRNGTDEGNTWLKVIRAEEGGAVGVGTGISGKGSIGRWNPFNRPVTKLSRLIYDYNRNVGIRGTR